MPPDASADPALPRASAGGRWAWLGALPVLLAVLAMIALQGLGPDWPPARRFLLQRGIDLLVLVLYFREFARHSPSFLEACSIFLVGSGLLFLIYKAALAPVVMILGMSALWLALAWLARRWPLRRGLLTVAVFLTLLQAVLALRQAMLPAGFSLPHALVPPLLLAVLAAVALLSTPRHALRLSPAQAARERLWADALVLALLAQAVLGAALRQGGEDFSRGFHFLWGALGMLLAVEVGWRGRGWLLALPGRRWLGPALVVMPVNQLALGLYLRLGGDAAWLTPLHTLNGLGIYVAACLVSASLWLPLADETP